MTQSPDQSPDLDEVFALYLKACDSGELTSREDFLKQFPSLSEELRELMQAADMIGSYTLNGDEAKSSSSQGIGEGWEDDLFATQTPNVNRVLDAGDTLPSHLLHADEDSGDLSGLDPNVTLPMANRPVGDSGPSLPFEMEDYTLLEVLGVGGMGVVYLAKQRELERLVAVKMIRSGMLAGKDEVKRFYTEAKAAARLRHPNIVAVHQFGRRAGHHFFSMQYIEGEDLQRVLRRGPLSPRRAAEVVRDVARAIDHAHDRGVLHRDLKPGNVLIDPTDQIHVTDFGLAKHVDSESSVTGSGAAVGTPHYMAPEQAVGDSEKATHQSDIYSLGAILFAAVAGRPPIVGDNVMQTLMRVAHHPAPPLRSLCDDADADLEAIVAKCLEKEPSLRYESASELAEDLDRYLRGASIGARARGRFRRVVDWTHQVPVVAALLGRPSADAPVGQRRLQTAIVSLFCLLPILVLASVLLYRRSVTAMPVKVQIAGGLDGGLYNSASRHLADAIEASSGVHCEVVPSGGTWDNRDRLLRGDVQLAPMQASAVGGEELRVVAPLFYEAVHLLVHKEGGVRSVDQLAGQAIAVGPTGSGSRRAAELVLESLRLDEASCPRIVTSWPSLLREDENSPEVAIICIGPGNELVENMLVDGSWDLVPLLQSVSISLQHPTLQPMKLAADAYDRIELPPNGIETVGTTAFLVARQESPDVLVRTTLESLYREPTLVGLIPARRAAEWQGLAFHRAARVFFDELTDVELAK